MDTVERNLNALLEQLGLPSGAYALESFVAQHRPLRAEIPLAEAEFWTPAQFLREAIETDAEWAEVVDELDALLRH